MAECQDLEDIQAILQGGKYALSESCKKLLLVWSMVQRSREYISSLVPSLSEVFLLNAGRKPGQHQRIRSGQSEPDILIDRHKINTVSHVDKGSQPKNCLIEEIRFSDPKFDPPDEFELHLKTTLPKAISKCHYKCEKAISATGTLIVRSFGTTS